MIKKILLGVVVIVVLFLIFRNTEIRTNEGAEEVSVGVEMVEGVFSEAFESENMSEVILENSQVTWFGENKIQAKSYTGTLNLAEGTRLSFVANPDTGNVSVTSGEFVVDMTSIASDNASAALLDHLKSPDFFEVETYPEARFTVTSYSDSAVRGDLTMKGVTQEVTIPYTVAELDGGYQFIGEVSLDRTLWGVTTLSGNFFDNVGDNLVEDMITISFNIQTI